MRLALVTLLAVSLPRPAPACTCSGAIDMTIRIVSPPPGVVLPLNGRIRITTDRAVDLKSASLRAASGDVIPLTLTTWSPGGTQVHELRPARLLFPGTKYELVVVRAEKKAKPEVVGSVTTGTGEDRTAPAGGKISEAFVHAMTDCGWCCSEGMVGEIRVSGLADFGMAEATLAYEIWVLPVGSSGPPTGASYGWGFDARAIRFGLGPMQCGPALLPRPRKKEKVRVVARAVDLAGNAGPTFEALLDFARPEPWRKGI